MNPKVIKYLSIILQLFIAITYLQTLYFKFTAHPDSVYIFSQIGLEPYGRVGLGVMELIVAILILVPKTKLYGGILSVGIISGAVASHLGPIGIEVHNDGGTLFYLALTVLVASLVFLALNFKEVIQLKEKLFFFKKS